MADPVKHARLFRNGANQALRIPREFEFDTDEVTLRREGRRLIIEPRTSETLAQVLDSFEPLDFGIDSVDDAPPAPEHVFE
jgi:antitoxin VapB